MKRATIVKKVKPKSLFSRPWYFSIFENGIVVKGRIFASGGAHFTVEMLYPHRGYQMSGKDTKAGCDASSHEPSLIELRRTLRKLHCYLTLIDANLVPLHAAMEQWNNGMECLEQTLRPQAVLRDGLPEPDAMTQSLLSFTKASWMRPGYSTEQARRDVAKQLWSWHFAPIVGEEAIDSAMEQTIRYLTKGEPHGKAQ